MSSRLTGPIVDYLFCYQVDMYIRVTVLEVYFFDSFVSCYLRSIKRLFISNANVVTIKLWFRSKGSRHLSFLLCWGSEDWLHLALVNPHYKGCRLLSFLLCRGSEDRCAAILAVPKEDAFVNTPAGGSILIAVSIGARMQIFYSLVCLYVNCWTFMVWKY